MLLRAETAGAEGQERDIQGVPCSFPSTLRSDVPDIQYLSTFSTRTRTFDVSTSPCESKTRSWIKRDNFNFSLCEEHGTDGFLTGRRLFRTTFNFFFFLLVEKEKERRKVYENRKESSGTRIRGVLFSRKAQHLKIQCARSSAGTKNS